MAGTVMNRLRGSAASIKPCVKTFTPCIFKTHFKMKYGRLTRDQKTTSQACI